LRWNELLCPEFAGNSKNDSRERREKNEHNALAKRRIRRGPTALAGRTRLWGCTMTHVLWDD
jgi:hypothetical protein